MYPCVCFCETIRLSATCMCIHFFLYHIEGVLSRVRAAEGNARAKGEREEAGDGRDKDSRFWVSVGFVCQSGIRTGASTV